MAEPVVFYLGRAAADDFGELLILCGNGRGIGAYKILRGMYTIAILEREMRSNGRVQEAGGKAGGEKARAKS